MKTKEAPEKIYLTPLECMAASCQPQKDNTVEYIRADAFIDKIEEYMYQQLNEGHVECSIKIFLENFKKYIE